MRMIAEIIQAIAQLNVLKEERRWDEAGESLDDELERLFRTNAKKILGLSDTELFALVIQGESTLAVREKTLVLSTFLSEAGEIAAAQHQPDESREYYLKALHLLLDVLGRGEVFEYPAFVPKVETLVSALQEHPLPFATRALLMQHYERTGELAKAEDMLYSILDDNPHNQTVYDFGIAFYQRALQQSDTALAEADLPRGEVEDGLREIQQRKKQSAAMQAP